MTFPYRSTRIEINLSAITENVRQLRAHTGVLVMAVVKANAYGHGTLAAAQAAVVGGAEWFGVAFSAEGIELVRAGIPARVMVLGYTPPGEAPDAIAAGLRLAVYDVEVAEAYAAAAREQGRAARVHVKVDTGMGRLGVSVEDAADLVHRLAAMPGIAVEGIFTHFPCADARSADATSRHQLREFNELVNGLTAVGLRPAIVHAANSAAMLAYPESRFDLVRPGIAIYGLKPSCEVPLPAGVRPALEWKSNLSSVREFPPGSGISYGHEYVTKKREWIGVVPVGYGDGYRRLTGVNRVIVRGRIVPVVGRVCMDQVMVRLDDVPDARRDDEVVIIGEQGGARITAEDVANAWGTVNYEVLCSIMGRVPRVYYG